MKIFKGLVVSLVVGLMVVGLSACDKEKGPAEKAGMAIDDAASKVAHKANETEEAVEKKLKD